MVYDEPVPIRKLKPNVPVDLETIVLRALEKNPNDRFGSAEEMLDELKRFLDDRPLSIRPVGILGRAVRYCRKRPRLIGVLATAIVLALISLATGLGVAINSRAKLLEAVQAERQQREIAGKNLDLANANLKLAKTTVDEWFVRFAEEWLTEQTGAGLTEEREDLLERAAVFYENYVTQSTDLDQDAERDQAMTLRRLARVKKRLDDRNAARKAANQAVGILERLVNDDPNDLDLRFDLIECRSVLAVTQPLEEELQIKHQILEDLQEATEEQMQSREWRLEYAQRCRSLAYTAWSKGDLEAADRYGKIALGQNADLLSEDPDDEGCQRQRIEILGTIIRSRLEWKSPGVSTGKVRADFSFVDTVALFKEWLRYTQHQLERSPTSWGAKFDFVNAASMSIFFLSAVEVEPLMLKALDIIKERLATQPDNRVFLRNLVGIYDDLRHFYVESGNFERAVWAVRSSIDHKLKYREQGLYLKPISEYARLGLNLQRMERYMDAIDAFDTAIQEYRNAIHGTANESVRKRYEFLVADIKADLGNTKFCYALHLLGKDVTEDHSASLQFASQACEHYAEARRSFEQTEELPEGIHLIPGLDVEGLVAFVALAEGPSCERFARALLDKQLPEESRIYMKRCLAAYETYAKQHPEQILSDLAWLLAAWPDGELREPRRAIELAMRSEKLESQPRNWQICGLAYFHLNEWQKCVENLEKAAHLREGTEWPATMLEWFPLALAHHHLGNADKAKEYFEKAKVWMADNPDDLVRQNKRQEAEFFYEAATKTMAD